MQCVLTEACEKVASDIQCRHLIPALNVLAAQTARPIATQFPGYGCMDDLTTERSFDLQAT